MYLQCNLQCKGWCGPAVLTKLDVIITEIVDPVEAPVEDLSGPLQGVEGDVEGVPGAEDHEVPHLAAVRPYLLRQVIGSIIDSQAVKGTAGTKTWNVGPQCSPNALDYQVSIELNI